MNIERKSINNKETHIIDFKSINEFHDYLNNTPINDVFRWRTLSSSEESDRKTRFTGTSSFNEAEELLKNGWKQMSEKLTQKLKVEENKMQVTTKRRTIYDVAGFQCSVPRYLQGVPTSMINVKNVPAKQKVITINKSIDYNVSVNQETIVDESIKALMIVKKIEAQGIKCNLNIVLGSNEDKAFYVKVRIKNANERLNISKLAFPLVHPSMLRRLLFRFIEVYPDITKPFGRGYGIPAKTDELKNILNDGEYLIPNFINVDLKNIRGFEDLTTNK